MRFSGERGGALIEVVVAVLILALTVPGIFGALLTASAQTTVSTEHERASLEVQSLLDELRDFVTANADPSAEAPGEAGTWHITGDDCGCWALQAGNHDVTTRLPADIRARGARMRYTVDVLMVNGQAVRRVNARLDWEPAP